MDVKITNQSYDLDRFELISEHTLPISELIDLTVPAYQDAFLKGIWKENLSTETVIGRLKRDFSVNFHGYWLIDKNNSKLASTSWFEYTNLEYIRESKSPLLAKFAANLLETRGIKTIVWYSETFTHSNYWGMGYAKLLTDLNFENIQKMATATEGVLVLLRMRDDNSKIININEKRGYKRTGITMPCTLKPDTNHEFWYKIYS